MNKRLSGKLLNIAMILCVFELQIYWLLRPLVGSREYPTFAGVIVNICAYMNHCG